MSDLLTKLGIECDKPNPGGFCGEWIGSGKPLRIQPPGEIAPRPQKDTLMNDFLGKLESGATQMNPDTFAGPFAGLALSGSAATGRRRL